MCFPSKAIFGHSRRHLREDERVIGEGEGVTRIYRDVRRGGHPHGKKEAWVYLFHHGLITSWTRNCQRVPSRLNQGSLFDLWVVQGSHTPHTPPPLFTEGQEPLVVSTARIIKSLPATPRSKAAKRFNRLSYRSGVRVYSVHLPIIVVKYGRRATLVLSHLSLFTIIQLGL